MNELRQYFSVMHCLLLHCQIPVLCLFDTCTYIILVDMGTRAWDVRFLGHRACLSHGDNRYGVTGVYLSGRYVLGDLAILVIHPVWILYTRERRVG